MCSSVDAEGECFTRLVHNLFRGQLEAVGIAFLAGKRAELARQDAVIRIVDVAIDDVAGALPVFFWHAKSAMAPTTFKSFDSNSRSASPSRNAFTSGNLVIDVAQLAVLNEGITS